MENNILLAGKFGKLIYMLNINCCKFLAIVVQNFICQIILAFVFFIEDGKLLRLPKDKLEKDINDLQNEIQILNLKLNTVNEFLTNKYNPDEAARVTPIDDGSNEFVVTYMDLEEHSLWDEKATLLDTKHKLLDMKDQMLEEALLYMRSLADEAQISKSICTVANVQNKEFKLY